VRWEGRIVETRQLEAFLAIVDIGSFTRAAARLHLTQSTVTARIKALEQELGSKLLDRRSSGITPTTAGAELLPYAREIVALTARARDALGSGGEPHGRLNVGTIESLTNYRLLPVIEHLYLRYPKVQISMHSPPLGEALSQVRVGQLQCTFFIDSLQDRDDLEVKVLCSEPVTLVCGRHHRLAGRPTVTDADVRHLTLVRADNNADYHVRLEHALHVTGGLVAFVLLITRTFLSKFTPAQATAAIVVSYYWHFVDVVWIGLFATIYFVR